MIGIRSKVKFMPPLQVLTMIQTLSIDFWEYHARMSFSSQTERPATNCSYYGAVRSTIPVNSTHTQMSLQKNDPFAIIRSCDLKFIGRAEKALASNPAFLPSNPLWQPAECLDLKLTTNP